MERSLPSLDNRLATFALIAVTLLVYAQALPNAFVWDDEEQVVNNPVIQDMQNIPAVITGSTFSTGGGGLSGTFYRPIVTISYLFNYQFWGVNPWGYHLFQILLHAATALLLFWILRRLLESLNSPLTTWLAFSLALIFAIHPAQVEAVAYVGSVGDILAAFFALLSFALLLAGIDKEKTAIEGHHLWGSIAAGALGLFAKENAVMIFPIAALYLFFFTPSPRKIFTRYIFGAAGGILLYLGIRLLIAHVPFGGAPLSPIAEASFAARFLTIPAEILHYIVLFFFPSYLSVSQHFVITSPFAIGFWGPLALLALAGIIVGKFLKNAGAAEKKIALFGIAWFFLGLLPVLNIIPLYMTVAERWLYFPMAGLLITAGVGIFVVLRGATTRTFRICLGAAVCIILLLSFRTTLRIGDWRDGLTLFGHDIQHTANSFDLENNYGTELFRAGRFAEAEEHFARSVVLQPRWTISRNNLGASYGRKGDDVRAAEEYHASIAIGDYYLAYENLAALLIRTKQFDEARTLLEKGARILPSNKNLAVMYGSLPVNAKK